MGAYWILLVAAVVIGLQGTIFYRFGLKKINYNRKFGVPNCFEGQEVELVETIENRKLMPVPWIRVESQFRAGLIFRGQNNLEISEGQFMQNHKSFFGLRPWTKIVRKHRVKASRRGVYRIGTVSMTSGDLLGIQFAVVSFPLEGRLVVYPVPMEPQDMSLPVQTWIGDMLVRRWIVEDPFQLSGIREYRDGDSMKDIHWKASARSGALHVHQRQATADSRLMIYLNVEDHEKMWSAATNPEIVEYGIRLAAGIAQQLLHAGMEAGLGSNGMLENEPAKRIHVPVSGGAGQLDLILDSLARLELYRSLSFHDYLEGELERLQEPTDIVILSTYFSARLELLMERYADRGHRVKPVLLENPLSLGEKGETA